MKDFKKGEGIEDLKESLYTRPDPSASRTVDLPPQPPERPKVAQTWQTPPAPIPKAPSPERRMWRKRILIVSVIFFFLTLLTSSAYFFFGSNSISAENIQVSLTGPFTIAAGDTMPLQVTVSNFNEVDIESALLVLTYPGGTKKSDGTLEDLFSDRIPINSLVAGQSINLPVRPIVFGEENQEFAIEALLQYNVAGSDATFEKRVAPLRYKISSTPVTLTVQNDRQIASGQDGDIVLTITSNAKTTINNLLIRAEYPNGFTFTDSTPAPRAGDNVWLIENLSPESTVTIRLSGRLTGQERDELVTRFVVGVARSNDFTQLATQFATAEASFLVENPFLAVKYDMDIRNGVRIAELGEVVKGRLEITNQTNETLYDVKVVMDVAGNAISRPAIRNTSGFFDENNNTVTWDPGTVNALRQMAPGAEVRLEFEVPVRDRPVSSPTITLATSAEARRLTANNISEQLVSTANGTIRVLTESTLLSEVIHVSGPQPPRVGQATTYKVTMRAQAGTNEITGAVVTTALPAYVSFDGVVGDTSSFNFNQNDRTITWNPGQISGGSNKTISFNVTYTPPSSHAGKRQILVERQYFRALDTFIEKDVTAEVRALETELSEELGFPEGNGRVVQ